MDAGTADAAIVELLAHIAQRQSLLAWTMRWCRDGEGDWQRIWSAASDAKSMLNVLVYAGDVTRARIERDASDASFRLVLERRDGAVVDRRATREELTRVVRAEIARPLLARLLERFRHPD
jgi:hypothetical protein